MKPAFQISLVIAAFSLLTTGCSRTNPDTNGTWRASVDNGDKPGIGLEIVRDGEKFTGRAFILDPNKPGDFTAGSPRTLQIKKATETEIHFGVDWLPDRHDDMVLRFKTPLNADRVQGVLENADRSGSPREFELQRIKLPRTSPLAPRH